MGAVDLVIQVESPTSVARGLQRVGRAGHQVGAPSKGVIFPKYRGDLLEVAVVTRRMHEGAIEATPIPRNPLDVLAQQLVAMTVMDRWTGRRPARDGHPGVAVRDADPRGARRRAGHARRRLPLGRVRRAQAAGRLGPRDRFDRGPARRPGRRGHERRHDPGSRPVRRVHGRRGRDARPARRRARRGDGLRAARRDARRRHRPRRQQLAGRRDQPRPGHRHARRPGVPGKLPFWKGDAVGPADRARARARAPSSARSRPTWRRAPKGRRAAAARLREHHDLDERAAENLLAYLEDEREATGALPTDKRIVVERFRDELGDWRLRS